MKLAFIVPYLCGGRRLPAEERLQVGVPADVAAVVSSVAAQHDMSVSRAAAVVLLAGLVALGMVEDIESTLG